MENEELLLSQRYVWFWFEITDKTNWETIFNNQVQFWDRIFEILWHWWTLKWLKDIWGWVFDSEKIKIHYFNMDEKTYKIHTPDGIQRIVKFEILEILD